MTIIKPKATHEWNEEKRGETEYQRLDRNFNELLQELRVAQTGIQILFAFLLTLAFTQRFTAINSLQHTVYVLTLCFAVAATGLLIAPVAYHRIVFRRRMRPRMVRTASILAAGGVVFLGLTLVSSMFFIIYVVTSLTTAIVFASVLALWLLLLWGILPVAEMIHSVMNEDDE